MKILHALVGYLTFTALPFHSFVFASPLAAIDHDGYVNITQNYIDWEDAFMKHILGIMDSETVTTTQSHKDSGLIKRVPGDIIEARQAMLIIPVVGLVLFIVADIGFSLWWISKDDPVRMM